MQDQIRSVRQEGNPAEEWEFEASYGTTVVVAQTTPSAHSVHRNAQLAHSHSHGGIHSPLS